MAIGNDSSNSKAIQTIAMTIHRLAHRASDADKAALKSITEDDSVAEAERTLAGIVATVEHTVNADGKAKLATLQ